jgi:hypothetical protein
MTSRKKKPKKVKRKTHDQQHGKRKTSDEW